MALFAYPCAIALPINPATPIDAVAVAAHGITFHVLGPAHSEKADLETVETVTSNAKPNRASSTATSAEAAPDIAFHGLESHFETEQPTDIIVISSDAADEVTTASVVSMPPDYPTQLEPGASTLEDESPLPTQVGVSLGPAAITKNSKEGRIVIYLAFKDNDETVNEQHDRRFSFWLHPRQGPCVDKQVFLSPALYEAGYHCVLCHSHWEKTFDGIVQHSVDIHGQLAESRRGGIDYCVYSSSNYSCDHPDGINGGGSRFASVYGKRLYHTLLGKVVKCYCGAQLPTLQHLGVHWLTCDVDLSTSLGSSLYSWFMHAFGQNYGAMGPLRTLDKKAGWLQLCFQPLQDEYLI